MPAVIHHIAALSLSALLALPPGICCGFGGQPASNGAANCCHQAKTQQQPVEPSHPAAPVWHCCCGDVAAIPAVAVELPDLSDVVGLFHAEVDSLFHGCGHFFSLADSYFAAGPKTHVLHCVWRC